MKLQSYSEEFMTKIQNGFQKGHSCTEPHFCHKFLIENEENIIWKHIYYLQIMKKCLIL
jgi:hypothetical protein